MSKSQLDSAASATEEDGDDDFYSDLDKLSSEKGHEDSGQTNKPGKRFSIKLGRKTLDFCRQSKFQSDPSEMNNEELRKRVKELEEENSVLKRNISTLYRTSREEIKRKDKMIADLQMSELDYGFSVAGK